MLPQMDCPSHIELPPNAQIVLRQMFLDYQRIVIKRDFTSLGYSGSWVYEVALIKKDGDDLPVVVKIAAVSLIEKEVRAYQACIKDRWPHVAGWRGEPVFHDELGGLAYTLVGAGIFHIQSLREYCLEAQISDIEPVLQRLFKLMKAKILLSATARREYRLRKSYDAVLPVNLLIEHLVLSASETPTLITPDDLPRVPLSIGTFVQLEGFIVTKVDLRDESMTLNLPSQSQNAYRLRLNYKPDADFADRGTFTHDLSDVQIGQPLPPLTGKVIENRASCFRKELQALSFNGEKVLGATFDPTSEGLTLADGPPLPNPLIAIPSILKSTRHLKFNHIHGDLNLENVLVDAEVRDFRLIDFAEARYEHVLHDFLRLETEVITKLLPTALAEAKLPAQAIVPFYQQLHCATFQQASGSPAHQALEKPFAILSAIRQAARDGFYDPAEFSEYYECLTLYLVGVLRFWNLDSVSKEVAFWGAATVQQLVTNPPTCANPRTTGRMIGYVSAIVGIVAAVVGIIFILIGPAHTDDTERLATLMEVHPTVEVRRVRTDDYQPGTNYLPLYYGDVAVSLDDGSAIIYCETNKMVFEVPSQTNVTVKCEDTADPHFIGWLDLKISLQILPTDTLSLEEDWSLTRADEAQRPLLLSPRNTVVTDTRPTFHWQEVEGASGYQIALDFPNGDDWQAERSQSSLSYSAAEPLPRGSTVIVKLATLDNPNLVDRTFLDVMDEASLAELAVAETEIRDLAVGESTKRYFLAQLYRQREIDGAAITQLEQIAATQEAISADLWQQLGDLYLHIELHAKAEENYQTALTIAQADGDQKAEANAYVGLALTANESTKVAEHLEKAEALYRQIGLDVRADQVAARRAELVP